MLREAKEDAAQRAAPRERDRGRRSQAEHVAGRGDPQGELSSRRARARARRIGRARVLERVAAGRIRERLRELRGRDAPVVRERERDLEDVAQVADVARPRVGDEAIHRRRRDERRRLARVGVPEEMLGEDGDLARPLSERQDRERARPEEGVELRMEPPGPHALAKVGAARAKDADVERRRPPVRRIGGPPLEQLEEPRLGVGAELADLGEQERALVRGGGEALRPVAGRIEELAGGASVW
jgi:hypothetical protein